MERRLVSVAALAVLAVSAGAHAQLTFFGIPDGGVGDLDGPGNDSVTVVGIPFMGGVFTGQGRALTIPIPGGGGGAIHRLIVSPGTYTAGPGGAAFGLTEIIRAPYALPVGPGHLTVELSGSIDTTPPGGLVAGAAVALLNESQFSFVPNQVGANWAGGGIGPVPVFGFNRIPAENFAPGGGDHVGYLAVMLGPGEVLTLPTSAIYDLESAPIPGPGVGGLLLGASLASLRRRRR